MDEKFTFISWKLFEGGRCVDVKNYPSPFVQIKNSAPEGFFFFQDKDTFLMFYWCCFPQPNEVTSHFNSKFS